MKVKPIEEIRSIVQDKMSIHPKFLDLEAFYSFKIEFNKLSPERISKKYGYNLEDTIKEINTYRKIIHHKIINSIHYSFVEEHIKKYNSKAAICIETYQCRGTLFCPGGHYLMDGPIENMYIIYIKSISYVISKEEFNRYFKTELNYKFNKIVDKNFKLKI